MALGPAMLSKFHQLWQIYNTEHVHTHQHSIDERCQIVLASARPFTGQIQTELTCVLAKYVIAGGMQILMT